METMEKTAMGNEKQAGEALAFESLAHLEAMIAEETEGQSGGSGNSGGKSEDSGGKSKTAIDWKRKLSSRKLWAAVVGVVVGLAAAFGMSENDWAQVAGIVTSAASVLAYIFGEAKVDEAAAILLDQNKCKSNTARQTTNKSSQSPR